MKASETSLRNLLEGTKQFQIPFYQRPFCWDKKNWEDLWKDLMSLYKAEVKGFYFLGSIVTLTASETAEGISRFDIIDGQQRLITLTLLLAALRDHLMPNNQELAQELHELYLINKFKKNDDFYKVLPNQNDREVYKRIIQTQSREIKGQGKIYEAYKFFEKQLKESDPDEDTSIDYAKLKTVVLECLMLVNITLSDIKVEDEELESRLKSEFKRFLRVKIDRYGRICIPKKVREQLGLSTSDQFTLEVVEDTLVLSPLSKTPKKERKSIDENQQAIAVQIPIADLEPIEEIFENFGLARLIEETGDEDDERLSKVEALKYYQALKGNNVDSWIH